MKELFERIGRLSPDRAIKILTVLDGSCAGEKAILEDGSLLWESVEKGFFTRHVKMLTGREGYGQIQIGTSRVFCDTVSEESHLVICGGGHVSIPVIRIGVMMGWHVTVLEDRPKFADHARYAGAQEVICMPFAEALNQIEGSRHTYFVILTRGHRYDQECLEKIIEKRHAYIGMIGSRRRSALVKQNLIAKGCSREVLEEVASPIGLDIGAETPEEIGVAIAAELIERKNKNGCPYGYPKEILQALQSEEACSGPEVLVTIVSRKGSAPRGTGTKMLISADGKTVGTIGGGCMEAEILQRAFLMMREGKGEERELFWVDMRNEDAEEEGMVCGGTVEILMEKI